MKNVPHWQLLVLLYFTMVAVPVYLVHVRLKAKAFAARNLLNLLFYFVGVIGAAVLLHAACMWLYFTFFFGVRD